MGGKGNVSVMLRVKHCSSPQSISTVNSKKSNYDRSLSLEAAPRHLIHQRNCAIPVSDWAGSN